MTSNFNPQTITDSSRPSMPLHRQLLLLLVPYLPPVLGEPLSKRKIQVKNSFLFKIVTFELDRIKN